MLPRYTRPAMAHLWSPKSRFHLWWQIESIVIEAQAEMGAVSAESAMAITMIDPDRIDPERIEQLERETRHDFVAFLRHLEELAGEKARHLHFGLTSSDVIDTAFAALLSRAADILDEDIGLLLETLRDRAYEHRYTPCVGRSHGIHAEPTTFGLKLAQAYAEIERNRRRIAEARREVATCTISGPVGTFASVDPRVEARVASGLGLAVEPISSQVIPRDRHAAYFCALAVVAGSVERIAIEIRHLQRTEVGEVEEPFGEGQRGSSAMPHKRNPILSENLTGLARLVRMSAIPALENIALWHERDISHSSVERVIAPDATATLDYALTRLADVVRGLTVKPDAMAANLGRLGDAVHSQSAMLRMVASGLTRDDAHRLIQRCVEESHAAGAPLLDTLLAAPEVAKGELTDAIKEAFQETRIPKHVDEIFERVFGHNAFHPGEDGIGG